MSDTIICECLGLAREHKWNGTALQCGHEGYTHGEIIMTPKCDCKEWRPIHPNPDVPLTKESVIGMCNNGVFDYRFRGDVEFQVKNLLPEYQRRLLGWEELVSWIDRHEDDFKLFDSMKCYRALKLKVQELQNAKS